MDIKTLGLKLEPEIPKDWDFGWTLEMFSDSDWAGDKDNRKSVSGYFLILLGVLITWKSRQQKTVRISSSEAEWIALSEAVKEILYVVQLLEALGIKVKEPVTVRVDNMGTIFMSKNTTQTKRTKHVDVRANFIYGHVDEDTGICEVVFVRSEENKSDIFT